MLNNSFPTLYDTGPISVWSLHKQDQSVNVKQRQKQINRCGRQERDKSVNFKSQSAACAIHGRSTAKPAARTAYLLGLFGL